MNHEDDVMAYAEVVTGCARVHHPMNEEDVNFPKLLEGGAENLVHVTDADENPTATTGQLRNSPIPAIPSPSILEWQQYLVSAKRKGIAPKHIIQIAHHTEEM